MGVANKSNFTAEEWDLLRRAPLVCGVMIMAASPSGPLGVLKESAALSQMLHHGLENASTELLRTLGADFKSHWSVEQTPRDPDQLRSIGLATCRELATLLRQKASPEECAEFNAWLIDTARRVAASAREGGFLGFGGTEVTEAELSAIDQIEIALR
jgi:hypothetical protein